MTKLFVSLFLLLSGMAVFVLGNPYFSVFPINKNIRYSLMLELTRFGGQW